MVKLLMALGALVVSAGAFLFIHLWAPGREIPQETRPFLIQADAPAQPGANATATPSDIAAPAADLTMPDKDAGGRAQPRGFSATVQEREPPIILPPAIPEVKLPAFLPSADLPDMHATTSPAASTPIAPPLPLPPPLPPLDERAILAAVVKIECPSEDQKGKYAGSGFLLPQGVVVTAAHLVMDSGSETCTIIFSKDRHPAHYLKGMITEDRADIKRRHDEEGIDVAALSLPVLSAYAEGEAVFPDGYPYIPYPICDEPRMLKDKLLHFGYPSNFLNQSYLSELDGEAVVYADIKGIEEQLSEDQTFLFKSPVFVYTNDQSRLHPYMISRVPSFYGDSGGLAFNAAKQCILGPHRGGTIGGAAEENFSVLPILGWERALRIIPR